MSSPYINTDDQAVAFLCGDPPWSDRAGWGAFGSYSHGLARSLDRTFAFLHRLTDVELSDETMAMVLRGLVDEAITNHGLACEPYLRTVISNPNVRYMVEGVMLPESDVLEMVERLLDENPPQH